MGGKIGGGIGSDRGEVLGDFLYRVVSE